MALCYVDAEQLKSQTDEVRLKRRHRAYLTSSSHTQVSIDMRVAGDDACELVCDVLAEIATIYG